MKEQNSRDHIHQLLRLDNLNYQSCTSERCVDREQEHTSLYGCTECAAYFCPKVTGFLIESKLAKHV